PPPARAPPGRRPRAASHGAAEGPAGGRPRRSGGGRGAALLVALRPGLVSPFLAAQMAGTFQRHSEGRLLLNVVTGGEPHEQRAYGDFLGKDERYERTGDFLHVVRELWQSREPI
ncbi:LLM class flavin-dependent oxidoreductase, partial [Nocardia nova]|nr:LLM class flavin-dependent oxidoreductase [Nocardia nova]